MRRMALLLPLPLLLVACWRQGSGEIGPNDRVVCVTNELAGYGNVMARAGEARFDVMPGATVCRRVISGDPRLPLQATTTGGGAAGPLNLRDVVPSGAPGCWQWRLGPGTGSSVLPMDCTEATEVS